MAQAKTRTLIPLDRLAFILGLDPFHFNAIETEHRPIKNACDDVFYRHDLRGTGHITHEKLAVALATAEQAVAQLLNWFPLPVWVENEPKNLITHHRPESYGHLWTAQGRPKTVISNWGKVITGGKRAKALVEAAVAVQRQDLDNDGYAETVQIVVDTDITDVDEIHVYFPGESGSDFWEIRPLTSVTFSGGQATITFPISMIPLPELWERKNDNDTYTINGDESDNFITTVDVYRVYNDPSEQLTFTYDAACGCVTDESGYLSVKDGERGILEYNRANWDTDTEAFTTAYFCGHPLRLTMSSRAGLLDPFVDHPYQQMSIDWERAIVFYAITLLTLPTNACEPFNTIHKNETEDLALNTRERSYSIPYADMNNPLGTTRAALRLWSKISKTDVRRTLPPTPG